MKPGQGNMGAWDVAVAHGVEYLTRTMTADGRFEALASPRASMLGAKPMPSAVFSTALIATALAPLKLPGWAAIEKPITEFLRRQLSEDWSVNYWARDSREAELAPYPDDLDDTFVSLAALTLARPQWVDGAAMGRIARVLTRSEAAVGGPYRTWLAGPQAGPEWQDVDLVVNGNVGYFLSLHDVELPSLNGLIEQALREENLQSPFYVGELPALYVWSRFYRGVGRAALAERLRQRLARGEAKTPLMAGLATVAGINLGLEAAELRAPLEVVARSQAADGSWPVAGLYLDHPMDGRRHFAGSAALTTAYCLEALVRAEQLKAEVVSRPLPEPQAEPPDAARSRQRIRARVGERARRLPEGELRDRFAVAAERMLLTDQDQQIIGLPKLAAAALEVKLPEEMTLHLSLGSLYGWVAYTIYDDFLDDEGQPPLLGVANVGGRALMEEFRAALPGDSQWTALVEMTLDQIEAANCWEVVRARGRVSQGVLEVAKVPDYGDLGQLAERSAGHALAAVGVMVAGGHRPDSEAVRGLQTFFRHFLIARQLNDDAHDWEDDLRLGHLNAAACQTLVGWGGGMKDIRVRLAEDLPELRRRFWRHEVEPLAARIAAEAEAACAALRSVVAVRRPQLLEALVEPLVGAAEAARRERKRTLDFLQGYQMRVRRKSAQ